MHDEQPNQEGTGGGMMLGSSEAAEDVEKEEASEPPGWQPPPWRRWTIALAAVLVHFCIGSVYAYSVFIVPLHRQWGWSKPIITVTFSIAIVVLGFTAAFGGTWMERHGPQKSALISAVCFGVGVSVGAIGAYVGSYWVLWIFYGFVAGIGLGLGYIAPVSTLIKWFPDRRGLATGMAVCGFGGSSLVMGPLETWMIKEMSVAGTLLITGLAFLGIMLLSAAILRFPPAGYCPAGYDPSKRTAATNGFRTRTDRTLREALRGELFWLFWICFFINISCGIMLIALAAPMAMETAGMTEVEAGVMVGLMGLFNGSGRLVWSTCSDYVGRGRIFTAMFVLEAVAFVLLAHVARAKWLFQILLFFILTCYGGVFAMCPAFLADMYGTRNVGSIHGVMLTAWSAAGIVGPQLGAVFKEVTKNYTMALDICAGMFVVAFLFILRVNQLLRRLRIAEQLEGSRDDGKLGASGSGIGDSGTAVLRPVAQVAIVPSVQGHEQGTADFQCSRSPARGSGRCLGLWLCLRLDGEQFRPASF